MNLINCGEDCRWQSDGQCTLDDISRISGCGGRCCHFEQKQSLSR